jgi:hypothetical protein
MGWEVWDLGCKLRGKNRIYFLTSPHDAQLATRNIKYTKQTNSTHKTKNIHVVQFLHIRIQIVAKR